MRIIHIIPGSGGSFYCQNCLRDMALVRGLRAKGHDVLLVPMYLPMVTDHPEMVPDSEIFYGAVGLYLRDRMPLLKKIPKFIQRLFDSPRLLAWAAGKAGSTRSSDLVDMTISMLRGEEGRQSDELDRLISWLSSEGKPEAVHLSNVLLIGLAGRIKRELGVPVVCSLQDEDMWVEAMGEEGSRAVWREISKRVADIDAFVSVSRSYAEIVQPKINVPDEAMHVVHMGIELDGFEPGPLPFDPPVIGYLSRITESLGAGLLADAFIRMKNDDRFRKLRLHYTGGWTEADAPFVRDLNRRFDKAGVSGDVEFVQDFGRESRIRFLRSVSVLSVPVIQGEAFGMHLLESLACGVPIVQPKLGGFPELIEATGGGVLYEPNSVEELTGALVGILLDPDRARELGKRGREAVVERFSMERMAENMIEVYERVLRS